MSSQRTHRTAAPLDAETPTAVFPLQDRRVFERVPIARIGVEVGNLHSVGRIYDISATGVRIEEAGIVPPIGATARLTFVLVAEHPPFKAESVTVRHTESGGFAVAWVAFEQQFRYLAWTLFQGLRRLPDLRTAARPAAPLEKANPRDEAAGGNRERPHQRLCERVPITVIGIQVGSQSGTGRICDVSATGLRIEECAIVPPVGAHTRLTFVLSVEQPPFEIEATVVRPTPTGGFAVAFVAVEPRLRELVAVLAARMQELPEIRG